MNIIGTVAQVRVGGIKPLGENAFSAIDKNRVNGKIEVFPTHLAGDSVADNRHHGGIDKAIHCYPMQHYEYWHKLFPNNPHFQAGGFGENFCIIGTDETQVCLGDVWQIGTTQLVVSQARQPCWKLNVRFGVPDISECVQASGRCGWYLRVHQTGYIQAQDAIILLFRPYPQWSIARLSQLIDSKNCEAAIMREVLDLPLPPSWHNLFAQRLKTGMCEDQSKRLFG